MKYENRVVAFIDILGFRSLLSETTDSKDNDVESKIEEIVSAYQAIKEIFVVDESMEKSGISMSKKVSIFSDCVVVSFKAEEPGEVYYTLLDIKHLIMQLVYRKILCRGAVSIGKFIHTDDYLFGPALVEAYTLESKAAMYPRVILDRDIIEAGLDNRSMDHPKSHEETYIESLLGQDSDGMYYIDYFYKAQSELDHPEHDFPVYIEILGDLIRKGLMGSSHHGKADLRIKYSWMRERYNNMIDVVSDKRKLMKFRDSGKPELAVFYESLKKISPHKDNKALHRTSR
ncbi:MAG: hypothetical protein CMQ34_06705 [Gammaproteobacteria bacterium]|nr:hypothetical protein [Gammaproteobacteria bacterium]|tara:strand:+ start:1312 stop:2172 length:861 start_codon:yes stop_codon:yes gene_type:complete